MALTSTSAAEIEKDLHELQGFLSSSFRPDVKRWLQERIGDCERRIAKETATNGVASLSLAQPPTVSSSTPHSVPLPTIKVTNYGWDQSEKFVKLYLTIPGVQSVPADRISVNFTENDVEMMAVDVAGKNYSLVIKGLCGRIDPSASIHKQKTDMLLIMMKKPKADSWQYLTRAEMHSNEKNKPKFDEKGDPQESLMGMMKQMYDDGDDEMKRSIRKAWHESQNKKIPGAPGIDDL